MIEPYEAYDEPSEEDFAEPSPRSSDKYYLETSYDPSHDTYNETFSPGNEPSQEASTDP